MYFRFEKQNAQRFRQAFILALFRGDFRPFSLLCGVFKSRGYADTALPVSGKAPVFGRKKSTHFHC